MARKQQTKARDQREDEAPKTARAAARPAAAKGAGKKVAARDGKAGKGGKSGGRKARERDGALDFVTQPIADTAARTKKSVRKAADQALKHVPEPGIPTAVTDLIRTIGGQIAGALNTDVGRVMVAELLIYIAKSLTKAAANTDAAQDAKSAILGAGAKIGAAAADAGARMVETGGNVASSGVQALEDGAVAAGEAAGGASNLMREVAQVAVGAMGGAVVEAASKVIGGRGSRRETKAETKPEPAGSDASLRQSPRPIPAL